MILMTLSPFIRSLILRLPSDRGKSDPPAYETVLSKLGCIAPGIQASRFGSCTSRKVWGTHGEASERYM
jgi:hypothetical protein